MRVPRACSRPTQRVSVGASRIPITMATTRKVAPTKTASSAGGPPRHDPVADREQRDHPDDGDERGLKPGP
jgi:hypothetical protein